MPFQSLKMSGQGGPEELIGTTQNNGTCRKKEEEGKCMEQAKEPHQGN